MGVRNIYYVGQFYSSFHLFPVWSDCWSVSNPIARLQLANSHDYWHGCERANQKKRSSARKSSRQVGYRSEWDWLCLILWLFIINSSRFLSINFKGLYWVYSPLKQCALLTGGHARPPEGTHSVLCKHQPLGG